MFRALVHFFALFLVAAAASAQVYKWVDEKGVTHYGERPPQGTKAREIQNKLGSGPATPGRTEDWQQKDRELRQRQIQAAASEEKKQEAATKQREQCNQQRDLLERLKVSRRTYELNAKGERVYLDDSERDAAIERQEKSIAERCPG